ncbi:MAG: hypothetical protein IKP49_03830 [Treponema sp.]|nr:hypothetical protein [Treponema sp.]
MCINAPFWSENCSSKAQGRHSERSRTFINRRPWGEIPKPSTIAQTEKRLRSGEIEVPGQNPEISYVRINTDKWRAENSEKSIRKNVTIPGWLCRKAEKANVNFSQLLQNSLKKYLNVD